MDLEYRYYILTYAWLLHLLSALILMWDPAGLATTPMAALSVMTGGSVGMSIFLLLFACACAGPALVWPGHHAWARPCFFPQHILLLLAAVHSSICIVSGHYPDGTLRSPSFILIDQLPSLVATFMHTLALYKVP